MLYNGQNNTKDDRMTRQKLDLPSSDLDIVAFISKEAHDLKSPFNRILGFTKMVLKGMDGPLTDMQKDDLNIVYQNSTQAMGLMGNLVDMARLSRGEKSFTPSRLDVYRLVTVGVNNWKQNHPEKQIEFETNLPDGELVFSSDEALLRQAISNLISYVSEYVQSPATVSISATREPGQVVFTFESRGVKAPGASECDMTMWGYIAQRIIHLHGGEFLGGEGDENGAMVSIRLPLEAGE